MYHLMYFITQLIFSSAFVVSADRKKLYGCVEENTCKIASFQCDPEHKKWTNSRILPLPGTK